MNHQHQLLLLYQLLPYEFYSAVMETFYKLYMYVNFLKILNSGYFKHYIGMLNNNATACMHLPFGQLSLFPARRCFNTSTKKPVRLEWYGFRKAHVV